jgi:hypothetical protein
MKIKQALILSVIVFSGCSVPESSDRIQARQQEQLAAEATAQTGMPAIKNFRERKLMKENMEMRDQDGLVTYTYLVAEYSGSLVFLCNSIGYGIPAAAQYTNPQKIVQVENGERIVLPQADPNGLFSPASAEGTWVNCANPSGETKTRPVYIEPRIVVSPFKLDGLK